MTVNLEIPKKKQIENAAKVAGAAVCAVIATRIIGNIVDKIHEKKQDKEIRKLKKELAAQEERIETLEAEVAALKKK